MENGSFWSGSERGEGGLGGWERDIVLAFGLLLFMTLLVFEHLLLGSEVSIKLIKFSENSLTYWLCKE